MNNMHKRVFFRLRSPWTQLSIKKSLKMLKVDVFNFKNKPISLINRLRCYQQRFLNLFQTMNCFKGGLKRGGLTLWLKKSKPGGGSLMESQINWPGIWPDIVLRMLLIVSAYQKNHSMITFSKFDSQKGLDSTLKAISMTILEFWGSL